MQIFQNDALREGVVEQTPTAVPVMYDFGVTGTTIMSGGTLYPRLNKNQSCELLDVAPLDASSATDTNKDFNKHRELSDHGRKVPSKCSGGVTY